MAIELKKCTIPFGDICFTGSALIMLSDIPNNSALPNRTYKVTSNGEYLYFVGIGSDYAENFNDVFVYPLDENGIPTNFLARYPLGANIPVSYTRSLVSYRKGNTNGFWAVVSDTKDIKISKGNGALINSSTETFRNALQDYPKAASMYWDGMDTIYIAVVHQSIRENYIYKCSIDNKTSEIIASFRDIDWPNMNTALTNNMIYHNNAFYSVESDLSVTLTLAKDIDHSELPPTYMGSSLINYGELYNNFSDWGAPMRSNYSQISFCNPINKRAYAFNKGIAGALYVLSYELASTEGLTNVPLTVHDSSVEIRYKTNFINVDDVKIKTRLVVNTEEASPYPSEFTPLPAEINYIVTPDKFPSVGKHLGIRLEYYYEAIAPTGNNTGVRASWRNIIPKVVNNPASIEATFSADTTHADNVDYRYRITDESNIDEITYQMTINDEVYIPYGLVYSAPLEVRGYIRPDELKIGANTIKLEVKSTFKGDTQVSSHTYTITKENKPPKVTLNVQSISAHIAMDDEDGDWIRFRIFLNGKQVLPVSDWSQGFNVPYNITYTLPRQYVNNGVANKVTVEVIDAGGDITKVEQNAVMNYSGLMFKDSNGKYYTNDKGEVLNVLDLGSITAGDPSLPAKVILENQLGYTVNNVKISCIPVEVDEEYEEIQFDTTSEFEAPQVELLFEDEMQNGGEIPFYVRVNTEQGAVGMGRFKIKASAEAVVG